MLSWSYTIIDLRVLWIGIMTCDTCGVIMKHKNDKSCGVCEMMNLSLTINTMMLLCEEQWKWKLCNFTKVVGPRRTSGVSFRSVLSASWSRGVDLFTALKDCALIVVWYLSCIDVVTGKVSAVFLTWWWNHDVEEVFPGPAVDYGIQKPLEGHCDGLCVVEHN